MPKNSVKEYALAVLESLVYEFPELLEDDIPVNGADLTEGLISRVYGNKELIKHLKTIADRSECV